MANLAAEAKRVLESDLWLEVMQVARQRLKDLWALEGSSQERELLWHRYQSLGEAEVEMKRLRDSGIMEAHNRGD